MHGAQQTPRSVSLCSKRTDAACARHASGAVVGPLRTRLNRPEPHDDPASPPPRVVGESARAPRGREHARPHSSLPLRLGQKPRQRVCVQVHGSTAGHVARLPLSPAGVRLHSRPRARRVGGEGLGLTTFVGIRGEAATEDGFAVPPHTRSQPGGPLVMPTVTRGALWPLTVAVGGGGAGPLPLGTVQSGPQPAPQPSRCLSPGWQKHSNP